MDGLRIAGGIIFLITALLEFMFMALSCLGTGLGGVMTGAAIAGEMKGEDAFVGAILLLFYGVWLLATVIAAPVHLIAGVHAVSGGRKKAVYWMAAAASLPPMLTVYCMMPAMLCAVFAMILALTPDPQETM